MKKKYTTIKVLDHEAMGEDARMERVKLRLSIRDVAKELGVSHTFYSWLERGIRSWDEKYIDRFNSALERIRKEKE